MSDLAGLDPRLRPAAEQLLAAARRFSGVRVTSVLRSYSTQARLYRNYVAGRSRYPAAYPGTSYHEAGRAFDVDAPPAVLAWMGRVWEGWGGTWGARFGDPIHFQA